MKRINLALISDSVFVALCSFLLLFTLLRFYIKSALWALILALVIAPGFGALAFLFLLKKRDKKLLVYADAREKKTLALHLSLSGDSYLSDLFLRALDGTYAVNNRLEDENCAYFLYFTLSPLSPDDVAQCIKCGTQKSKVILCCKAGEDSAELARDFNVSIKQIGEIYAALKDKNLLPEKYICGEIKKVGIWEKIKKRFNRKLCPSLFFCGFTLLFFSFFTFYRIYYIVFGGLLITLSAVCLLFGQSKS